MVLGVILPHTKLYGGVKRFLELGNIFIEKGHRFIVFVAQGGAPDWFNFKGEVIPNAEIENHKLDVLFFTEPRFIDIVDKADAVNKVIYLVRSDISLKKIKKRNVEVFANSTNMYELAKRKYGMNAFKAFGGINLEDYSVKEQKATNSDEPLVIMAYGRLSEGRKGTKYVVKACEQLYRKGNNIKLLLFDTPVDEKMKNAIATFKTTVPFEFITNHPVNENVELFHKADIFVAPEKKAGWSNTSVEAMAAGIPVIATDSGTKDFLVHEKTGLVIRRSTRSTAEAIKRLIEDKKLRVELAVKGRKKIEEFDWHVLAERILNREWGKQGN